MFYPSFLALRSGLGLQIISLMFQMNLNYNGYYFFLYSNLFMQKEKEPLRV